MTRSSKPRGSIALGLVEGSWPPGQSGGTLMIAICIMGANDMFMSEKEGVTGRGKGNKAALRVCQCCDGSRKKNIGARDEPKCVIGSCTSQCQTSFITSGRIPCFSWESPWAPAGPVGCPELGNSPFVMFPNVLGLWEF